MDYRELLRENFLSRVKRNPLYSIRAFARDIGLSASFLSQVLNNRRRLTETSGVSIAQQLNWSEDRQWLFLKLIQLEKSENAKMKEDILEQIVKHQGNKKDFTALKADRFKFISEWHHMALMELMELKDFRPETTWMAKRLGITTTKVTSALNCLFKLGLIELDPAAGIYKNKYNNQVKDTPSEALRNAHKAMIKKALTSIDRQSYDRRHISGITFAVNENKLEEAKKRINQFRKDMSALLEVGDKTSIYQLNIQLFEISTPISPKGETR